MTQVESVTCGPPDATAIIRVIDRTKVVRSALQNAVSVASLLLTTDSSTELPTATRRT